MMLQQPPPHAPKRNPERATPAVARPIHPSVLEAAQRRQFAQRLAVLIARLHQATKEETINER